jgi:hypothetical protein
MSIATEILSLRQNQSSSVETLLALLDWQKTAYDDARILARRFAVKEAADLVLLNVAVHAAEALSEPPTIRRTRRGLTSWFKRHNSKTPESPQARRRSMRHLLQ